MRNRLKGILFFALLILIGQRMAMAQEEVILSSENLSEAMQAQPLVMVVPKYRHVDSTQQKSVVKIGLRPSMPKYYRGYNFSGARGQELYLVLGYEHLLPNHQFSIFFESHNRLGSVEGDGYDYENKFRLKYNGHNINRGGEYDANISSFDIGGRFYYGQRQRVDYGASGINQFSEYVFLKVRDVFSRIRRSTLDKPVLLGAHRLVSEERLWTMSPGYIQGGWGIQRGTRTGLLIDFYTGIGMKFAGKREHASDVMFEMVLILGFGLGKKG